MHPLWNLGRGECDQFGLTASTTTSLPFHLNFRDQSLTMFHKGWPKCGPGADSGKSAIHEVWNVSASIEHRTTRRTLACLDVPSQSKTHRRAHEAVRAASRRRASLRSRFFPSHFSYTPLTSSSDSFCSASPSTSVIRTVVEKL